MRRCDTLTGLVIGRDSPLYNEGRLEYNTGIRPACPLYIVYCQDVHDVQNAICWARRHSVPIRVRSGAHSYEGYSVVDGGVVIDVSPLNQVVLDGESGRATIGAGAALLPIYQALWDRGRVTIPGGSCPTVGMAGLTLGGGFGLVSRLFGLACDALESLHMVTTSGEVVLASDEVHRDLFWASCGGGGGNFGVVTSFAFRTFAVDKVTTFFLGWPWSQLGPVMRAYQVWADPVRLDARVVPLLTFTSQQVGHVVVVGEFVGPPDELEAILAPLVAQVPPVQESVKYRDYIDAVYYFAGVKPPTAPPGFEPLSVRIPE
jgi:FAD/FMN-containing dehydrogenase